MNAGGDPPLMYDDHFGNHHFGNHHFYFGSFVHVYEYVKPWS